VALAGVAFSLTGPSAIVAFALNGLIAFMTAASIAEMSSKFPESGGMYIFAKRVVSIEAAFSVGWVVWFASIAAAALYATGFAYFGLVLIRELWQSIHPPVPADLASSRTAAVVAAAAVLVVALSLMRRPSGAGPWGNMVKIAVFTVLILGGVWASGRRPMPELVGQFRPFFAQGMSGLVQAMGFTFIALQGFDLIAAVAGEVRDPSRNIPRSMFLSLGVAMAIYLPLLAIITAVGVPAGGSVQAMAGDGPETLVADAARHYLGSTGFWLVIVAAVLAMFTALQSNLFAASRIAQAMARDRTMPASLRHIGARQGTPWLAILASAALVLAMLLLLPGVTQAGAAASLIFLITFALAHWTSILVRQRSTDRPPPFRTPLYPAVPIVGGVACLALALFQGLMVPAAGFIAITWLAVGGLLFLSLFARRARVHDAARTALDPELSRLRGTRSTILVPIANPDNGPALIGLARTLTTNDQSRLLGLTIIVPPDDWDASVDLEPFVVAESVARQVLVSGRDLNMQTESMLSIASDPVDEITRLADHIRPQLVVLGLSHMGDETRGTPAQRLLGTLQMDIVVLRSSGTDQLVNIRRVLVLVGSLGTHDSLRARLLGSLIRAEQRNITYLRVLPAGATRESIGRARRELASLAADEVPASSEIIVQTSDDPLAVAATHAGEHDLVVLGVQRVSAQHKLFGRFTRRLAQSISIPMVVISRRG